jgi:hypothetical protein
MATYTTYTDSSYPEMGGRHDGTALFVREAGLTPSRG